MQAKLTATLIATALGSTLFASMAHAGQTANAHGFSAELEYWVGGTISVLSDTGSTVQLGLSAVDASTLCPYRICAAASYSGGAQHYVPPVSFNQSNYSELKFHVKEGYRIESFTLTGKTIGTLKTVPVDVVNTPNYRTQPGSAHSSSTWLLGVGDWSSELVQADVTGTQPFALNLEYDGTGDFALRLGNGYTAELESAYEYRFYGDAESYHFFPSSFSLDASDVVLTVQLAPVPEPGTYGMLLLGLGVLGVAARKSRRVALKTRATVCEALPS